MCKNGRDNCEKKTDKLKPESGNNVQWDYDRGKCVFHVEQLSAG